jgi:hypothetical protein
MTTKRSTVILSIAFISAFCSVALSLFFLYSIYDKSASLTLLEENLAAAEQQQNGSVAMKHLLSDTKEERTKLETYFIGKDGIVSFIESVESLGKLVNAKVSVNSIGVDQGNGGNMFEYVTMNATAEGNFSNLFWFLSLVEHMPLKLEVSKVSLDDISPGFQKKDKQWRLTFVLEALKLK